METNIQVPPRKLANSNKYYFSQYCMFHLNRVINGFHDVALEEDFEIQKPLEVLILTYKYR